MRPLNPWLRFALDYGPLIAFFAVFMRLRDQTVAVWGTDYSGVLMATLVFVPLTVVAAGVQWALTRRLSVMQLLTLAVVVVMGGLTIWLNDPRFVKMKPTLIYLIFAGLLGLGLALRRNWLGMVLGEVVPLQPEGWRRLTRRLTLLFLGLAVANEAVWRTQSDATWVSFKTFGLPVLLMLFFVLNAGLISRYALSPDNSDKG